jgi:hypothetical protein
MLHLSQSEKFEQAKQCVLVTILDMLDPAIHTCVDRAG